MKWIKLLGGFLLTIFFSPEHSLATQAHQTQQQTSRVHSNIFYLQLPSALKSDRIQTADELSRIGMHEFTVQQLTSSLVGIRDPFLDVIIVFTDEKRKPILPDLERGILSSQIGSGELTFTFNSTAQPWTQQEIDSLRSMLQAFYTKAKDIYGNPAFNITVNVRKDTSISVSGFYYASTNEMVVKSIDQQTTICHEMIHAFRDDLVIGYGTYEEGMTRAAEVEVFNQLDNYQHWNENHGHTYDVFYEVLNQQSIATKSGNVWSNVTLALTRYQISSYVWAKAYLEDQQFLKNFNARLYYQVVSDPSVLYTESKLKDIVQEVKPTIEDQLTSAWYNRQYILDSNPSPGYQLFQRINQFTIDHFFRDHFGNEIPQGGIEINWFTYDYNEALIDSGRGITTSYGWIDAIPHFSDNYYGRVKLVCTVMTSSGVLTSTSYRNISPDLGVFGVVTDANSGTITITPLDIALPAISTTILNGAFSAPSLKGVRGRFQVTVIYPNSFTFSRVFTKDASDYFLLLSASPSAPTLASPSNGATGVSTSAALSWNSSSGATSYRLQVSTNSSFTSLVYDQSGITSTSRQVSGLANSTLYYWRVNATNAGGTSDWSSVWGFTTTGPTLVEQFGSDIPTTYALYQNYPNPFNPVTTIQFSLPRESPVVLTIFNSLGMQIEVLVNQNLPPGHYRTQWTPREIPTGVYFYQLKCTEFTDTKKLLLLR